MKKNNVRQFIPYLVLAIVVIVVLIMFGSGNTSVNQISYNELIDDLSEGNVTEISTSEHSSDGVYYIKGKLKNYQNNEYFVVYAPLSETVQQELTTYYQNSGFKWEVETDPSNSSAMVILLDIVPTIIVVVAAIYLFSRLSRTNNSSFDFGKSKAKLADDKHKVKFSDVAGLDEEKEEVAELIDFLKDPKKYNKMGARIPKGVLLVGPPGTGKTLLAKSVAGEANVPFYYISGSDFVELFVGVGASRVRDMFREAKQNAPCLIFIDEIDAVGRQRGTGLGGGHDEREQTLNQLLTEMDGFGANEGIIVIAATNRPDVLDPALLRPGRFDRQITVSLPDQKARLAILKVHARGKKFNNSVDLEALSKRTPGFSGADLENLLNEAALLAVRDNKDSIGMSEIDEATDRVLMGPAKKSRKYTDKEKELVAIHEAGHAVVGLKLPEAEVVQKITIIPRGVAGGYTMMLPKEEKMAVTTKQELLGQITGLLGGRVSEQLFLGQITTGGSDDFSKATKIARAMVTRYGMSDLGPIELEEQSEGVFLGRDYNKNRDFSDAVALEIDKEVQKIINQCYKETTRILKENEKLVRLIANTLIEKEIITKEEIEELVSTGHISTDEEKDAKAKTKKDDDESIDDLRDKAKDLGIKGYSKMSREELEKAIKNSTEK